MECSVAIQFLPMDAKDDKTICKQVDAVIAYIASTGVNYFVAPFETTIEGSYEQCLEIVKNCPLVGAQAGCHSMMTYVKINYHPQGKVLSTAQKYPRIPNIMPQRSLARKCVYVRMYGMSIQIHANVVYLVSIPHVD